MTPYIIDGRKLAKGREEILKQKVAEFISQFHRKPKLVAVELTDDSGGKLYLKLKQAAAERIGIDMRVLKRPGLAEQSRALTNADAVFIQHPPGYDKKDWQKLADQIPPEKDVDCLTTENLNLVKQGKPRFLPATVKAVLYCLAAVKKAQNSKLKTQSQNLKLKILESEVKDFIKGKLIAIFGRSPIMGLPLSWWLTHLGGKVLLLYSQSSINDLRLALSEADVIISAVGKPKIITGDMVKTGVIAIDCGSPVGDMDFPSVSQKAAAITPVPGGVGPLTVVSLMENVVESAHHASQEGS